MADVFNTGSFIANEAESIPQHSFIKSVALHLLPAVFVFTFYILAAPFVIGLGFPPGLALLLGFLFIGTPIELGYLLYLGKKRNGTFSLRGIVLYRERIPIWQYFVFFVLLLAFAFSVLFLISPVTEFLAENVFSWLPKFLLPDGSSSYPPFAPTAILVTLILGLIFDGIVNPIIEELYFRGCLLPRISRFGWLAPLMSAFLFSLQHYWQPYNFPLIFLIQLAIVYVVWWKRNIYISMLAHCAGNLIGATLSLVGFLSSS
jgi:membrane protease YdiL (CAAX protease family)